MDHPEPDLTPPTTATAFEIRVAYGIGRVLGRRPELREVMAPAALLDESLRWCA